MNREIKFRAWDNGYFKPLEDDGDYYFQDYGDGLKLFNKFGECENVVLLQFTGLKDKNGREIYEGDVIQYKSYFANKKWWSNVEEIPKIDAQVQQQREDVELKTDTVKFADGAFILNYQISLEAVSRGERFKTGRTNWCDTEEKQWDFEVIGNVFENPELLKS